MKWCILSSHKLQFHDTEGKHLNLGGENVKHMFVKFRAIAITQNTHTLKPTICNISMNLLRYILRQITK